MFIAGMTIKEGRPRRSRRGHFKFDEHVNVFVGPNASGKSTLLKQMLNNCELEWIGNDRGYMSEPKLSDINNRPIFLASNEHCVFALEDSDADRDTGDNHMIIIPATRVRYKAAPEKDGQISWSESRLLLWHRNAFRGFIPRLHQQLQFLPYIV